jgi:predicted XRE-type DNA-binding protein
MKGSTRRKTKPAAAPAAKRAARQASGRSALAGSAHVTPAGGNVFADLGFPPEEAENLKIRSRLMGALCDLIAERGLTQAAAGRLFGVAQPRVSDLVRGKIELFTIDALVNMLARAGVTVRVQLGGEAAEKVPHRAPVSTNGAQ